MEPQRHDYKGHRIEVRAPEAGASDARVAEPDAEPVLLIDDQPVPYGQLPDGEYFLEEYAYDWHEDLVDLARRFIDYTDESDLIRAERERESAE